VFAHILLRFTSCHDLVLSRFCAADYKEQGVSGIKIHRITRIHNRILKNRFDDELAANVDMDDSVLPTAKYACLSGCNICYLIIIIIYDICMVPYPAR